MADIKHKADCEVLCRNGECDCGASSQEETERCSWLYLQGGQCGIKWVTHQFEPEDRRLTKRFYCRKHAAIMHTLGFQLSRIVKGFQSLFEGK
jgi:hypothetical protein